MEHFLISKSVHVKKEKKNPRQIFPDSSLSGAFSGALPYILTGILKTEKEQEQLKAFGAIQFFHIPSVCPFIYL